MIEVAPAPPRTVIISNDVLARICPDVVGDLSSPPMSPGLGSSLAGRVRLAIVRAEYRLACSRALRCRLVAIRLRARLAWVRWRYRNVLS